MRSPLLDTHPPAHTDLSWQTQSTPSRTTSDDATAAKTTLRTRTKVTLVAGVTGMIQRLRLLNLRAQELETVALPLLSTTGAVCDSAFA